MHQKPNEWSTDAEMLKSIELENEGQKGNGAKSLEIIIAKKKCEIHRESMVFSMSKAVLFRASPCCIWGGVAFC